MMTITSAQLEQNIPNPYNGTTVIRYHLPGDINEAKLVVTNMQGQVLRTMALNSRGNGQVTLRLASLAAGTYAYTLWVDGQKIDTKQMVVSGR
jgi:hypothetical protein